MHKQIVDIVTKIISEKQILSTLNTTKLVFQNVQYGLNYSTISVPFLDASNANLSADLNVKLNTICEEIAQQKGIEDKNSIFNAIVRTSIGIFYDYLTLCTFNHSLSLSEFINDEALRISSWIAQREDSFLVNVFINPDIKFIENIGIDRYYLLKPDLFLLSKLAQTNSHSGQESLSYLSNLTIFQALFSRNEFTDYSTFIENIDIINISLILGTKTICCVDDIQIIPHPWKQAPIAYPFYFPNYPKGYQSSTDNMDYQYTSMFTKDIAGTINEQITTTDFQNTVNWINLLQSNPTATYSFMQIIDGFLQISKSAGINIQYFKKHRKALDGIYLIISGLEGINSNCKPIQNGHRILATKTFCDCWKAVAKKAIENNPTDPILQRANFDDLFNQLYDLRSNIVHSDPTTIQENLKKTKKSLGDFINPDNYTAELTGICLVIITIKILNTFVNNNNLLQQMLLGTKP